MLVALAKVLTKPDSETSGSCRCLLLQSVVVRDQWNKRKVGSLRRFSYTVDLLR